MSTVLVPKIASPLPHHLLAGKAPILNGLTLRQAAFVDKYIETQNATLAVMFAYGTEDKDVAASRGSQLLRLGKVKIEIQRRLGTSIADSTEVLERLTNHARADIADVLEPNGEFDLRKAKKRGTSQLLKKLKIKTRYEKDSEGNLTPVVEREFELHDPQAALEKLGRFHKLFTDKVETEFDSLQLAADLLNLMRQAAEQSRTLALNPAPETQIE